MCVFTVTATLADKKAIDTSPAEDLKAYQDFFFKRFQGLPLEEYANGVYAIDKVARDSWQAIEEIPPYEPMIDEGEDMWNTPFANGKSYGSCFNEDPAQRKEVIALPLTINECREANGEKPLRYKKGAIANLLAYISSESRGHAIDVKIPNDDALAAYND